MAVSVKTSLIKAGLHVKAVFWLGILVFMQISRLHLKASRIPMLITHINVLAGIVFM